MKYFNIWSWPAMIIDDIRQWRLVSKALKEAEVIDGFSKFKYELRRDKIGRVYTVINIPEELMPYEKRNMVWPWMLEQLRELDDLLMSLRLNYLLYPEVTPIEGSPAYLIILSPSTESLDIWKFVRWFFNLSLVCITLYLANRIAFKVFGSTIIDSISSLL